VEVVTDENVKELQWLPPPGTSSSSTSNSSSCTSPTIGLGMACAAVAILIAAGVVFTVYRRTRARRAPATNTTFPKVSSSRLFRSTAPRSHYNDDFEQEEEESIHSYLFPVQITSDNNDVETKRL